MATYPRYLGYSLVYASYPDLNQLQYHSIHLLSKYPRNNKSMAFGKKLSKFGFHLKTFLWRYLGNLRD
jgi:hypothetical protein